MKNGLKINLKLLRSSKGLTLLEVMLALTVFAVFATAFSVSQGYLLVDSVVLKEEMTLQHLAETKLNEIKLDPPEFQQSLTLSEETKTFELKGFENYQYTVEYRRLELPDLNQLQGKEEDDPNDKDQGIKKRVFTELKKNVEEIIWQVSVTVTNKETQFTYSLSSWLTNPKAKVKINI